MRDLAETRASSATGGALMLPRESTALGDDFRLPLWTKSNSGRETDAVDLGVDRRRRGSGHAAAASRARAIPA
jgi:hypothetical protein